ncbi:hypothetical protein KIN20_020358 [Parelaphostrongylus tenuis]|uniref:Ubiquitin-like domain-containing protein n=1 Tax=Parelaphostrongylus tenuis TaxID=148309 RepID=A0AAD5QTG4_PARTN|nr:hypothetical protein KIN20_020358 [Parelaphostrongylus tenuis]
MNNFDNTIMIYLKNERGVAVPIHVNITDRIHVLLIEAATIRVLHRGSLHGKALYYKGRRLNEDDVIGDVGIKFYDTVRLQTIETSSAETKSPQAAGDDSIVAIDDGPIERHEIKNRPLPLDEIFP